MQLPALINKTFERWSARLEAKTELVTGFPFWAIYETHDLRPCEEFMRSFIELSDRLSRGLKVIR